VAKADQKFNYYILQLMQEAIQKKLHHLKNQVNKVELLMVMPFLLRFIFEK